MHVAGGELSVSGGICLTELEVKCVVDIHHIVTVRTCHHNRQIKRGSYSRTVNGAILKTPLRPVFKCSSCFYH